MQPLSLCAVPPHYALVSAVLPSCTHLSCAPCMHSSVLCTHFSCAPTMCPSLLCTMCLSLLCSHYVAISIMLPPCTHFSCAPNTCLSLLCTHYVPISAVLSLCTSLCSHHVPTSPVHPLSTHLCYVPAFPVHYVPTSPVYPLCICSVCTHLSCAPTMHPPLLCTHYAPDEDAEPWRDRMRPQG